MLRALRSAVTGPEGMVKNEVAGKEAWRGDNAGVAQHGSKEGHRADRPGRVVDR